MTNQLSLQPLGSEPRLASDSFLRLTDPHDHPARASPSRSPLRRDPDDWRGRLKKVSPPYHTAWSESVVQQTNARAPQVTRTVQSAAGARRGRLSPDLPSFNFDNSLQSFAIIVGELCGRQALGL